jgi:hypothetical protein
MVNHDEDPLDLLEDDGDGVNEMCLFFDDGMEKKNSKGSPQGTGCGFVLLLMGASVITSGFLIEKFMS